MSFLPNCNIRGIEKSKESARGLELPSAIGLGDAIDWRCVVYRMGGTSDDSNSDYLRSEAHHSRSAAFRGLCGFAIPT